MCSSSDLSYDIFNSDSTYESDEPTLDGVDGFVPNTSFSKPHRNLLDKRTRELFLSNSNKLDESRTVSVKAKNGSLIKIRAHQVRRKDYHIDVFAHSIKLDRRYDLNHVRGLTRQEKAEYVLGAKNLPQDLVHEMQDEFLEIFTSKKLV